MMHEYRIVWLRPVFDDMQNIKAYLEEQSESGAARVIEKLLKSIGSLRFMPSKHQRFLQLPFLNLRQYPVENWIILFRIKESQRLVEIVLVDRVSRDLATLLTQSPVRFPDET